MFPRLTVLVSLLLVFSSVGTSGEVGSWLVKFAGRPTRYLGSLGHRSTLDLVEAHFRACGLKGVRREALKIAAPGEGEAWIEGPGLGRTKLYCVWPNHVRLSTTPRDGLSGRLIDAGHGEAEAFDGRAVDGAIALVKLPCADGPQGWTTSFILGAAAVIFLPPDEGMLSRVEAEELFLDVPANLPRFWASEESARVLKSAARRNPVARLVARAEWKEITTWNIWGVLPGSEERFPSADLKSKVLWRDKQVILQAYTDSNSVVPALAPGAEEAGGLIGLMELASHLSANPVPSSVIFLATSGHGHFLSGSHEFMARHIRHEEYFSRSITADEKLSADYFIGLDLTSGDNRVASFAQSTFYESWENDLLLQSTMTGPARIFDNHATKLFGRHAGEYYLNGVSPPIKSWKDLLGFQAAFDAEAASVMGTRGLTLATPFDARLRVDTPNDTRDKVNVAALERQVETVKSLLSRVLADRAFFEEVKLQLPDVARAFKGEVHEFERTVTGLPQKPMAGVLMTAWSGKGKWSATVKTYGPVRSLQTWFSMKDDPLTTSVTETGMFRVPVIRVKEWWAWVDFDLRAFMFDEGGEIILTSDTSPITAGQFKPEIGFEEREGRAIHVLFRCKPLAILEPVDARHLRFLDWITVLDGTDQPFMNGGFAMIDRQSQSQEHFTPSVVLFAPSMPGQEVRAKALLSTGPFGLKGLFTGADESLLDKKGKITKEEAQGRGYSTEESTLKRSPFEAAKDMWVLDEERGGTLKEHNVRNWRVEELHERARAALEKARVAWRERKYAEFLSASREAWGLEARAYPEFKAVANDLVRTVVFYCVLLLPFSYCMERLLFTSADLRRQLAATGVIFVLGFLALRAVHPAFKISSNPIIIFLGFIVLTLGLIVLAIISTKFQRELRRMKGERGDYESVDIGRASATIAALTLGLSNLRKRPMRTVLTITTVVILTFTVLSMVSMTSTIRFFRLPRGSNPPYMGAMVRDVRWNVLQPPIEQYLRSAVGDIAHTVSRSWVTARSNNEALQLEVKGKGEKAGTISAILGLQAAESMITSVDRKIGLRGRWFEEGDGNVCLVPRELAVRLGVDAGDSIMVRGIALKVVGTYKAEALANLNDLDGESITPAKFSTRRGRYDWEESTDMQSSDKVAERLKPAEHLSGDSIVVVPFSVAMSLEGKVRSVAAVPRKGVEKEEFINRMKEFLVRAAVMALVSDGSNIQLMTSIGAVSVKGVLSLLVPMALACLIVLNTMMGSVHERVREISIFSSVGLAPSHIGALFLAEAFVVAVVGVVLGYLLAQLVSAVMLATGTLAGLSLNYSSSAAVGASIIVMAAIMLSTLYPARRASELAVPDVTRRWKLPKPAGDLLIFDFPFTIGAADLVGLFAYLADLFRAYRDSSIGSFSTDQVVLARTSDGVKIEMLAWLAPYDLGISEHVKLEAIPMDVKGLFVVKVNLERRSGEFGAWYRQNRRFLTTLRKRFLIWRMFGPEMKARYAAKGNQEVEGQVG